MANKTYQTVKRDVEELDRKIRAHRRNILILALAAAAVCLAAAAGIFLYYQSRTYQNYQVLSSVERKDSQGTQFAQFQGNILKYSNDGAFYIDSSNRLIWNQTYEMQDPQLDVCEEYAIISEKNGKRIYIMDTSGPCGQINTSMPIRQVHVANQGTVAVLMEDKGVGSIHLFDKEGNFLAEGELHAKNSGYPLDISLSDDGKKMAVSMLDINEGNLKTTVAFYNFGSVGQNEIDNITGTYSYTDNVIPRLEFVTNDMLVAFGNDKIIIFEGSQKPEVKKEMEAPKDIQSIFFNKHYMGFICKDEKKEQGFSMAVYDFRGSKECSVDFKMKYDTVEFLQNDEICIRSNTECAIYNLRGIRRFHFNFNKSFNGIYSTGKGREYTLLLDGATQRIKLK